MYMCQYLNVEQKDIYLNYNFGICLILSWFFKKQFLRMIDLII